MPILEKNKSLRELNTFGIDAKAHYFAGIHTLQELRELLQSDVFKNERHLILGGGSNVLFMNDFDGLIMQVMLKGIEVIDQNDETITIRVAAGEVWHDVVMHCVQNNWGGIENLSLIPGTMGAAPIQNIGAYGVEIKEVIKEVEVIDLKTGEHRCITHDECRFGYRESAFKSEWKEKYFISSVTLTLHTKRHQLNMSYGAINDTLRQMNVITPSIQTISEAVVYIRQSKLPDPRVIGNAGSFFKNPTITQEHYQLIKNINPTAPSYPTVNQEVKVPAGWLIEQCGWKGKKINDVGVHAQQALVLVNYGSGSGKEIFELSRKIIESVKEKFNITLTPEVNIIA